SHLYGEGNGCADRRRQAAEIRRRRDGVVLAHRRGGGALRVTGLADEEPLKLRARQRRALRTSSIRNRSVSSARRWIDALRLSTSCELIEGCARSRRTAASASTASRSITCMNAV